MMLEEVARFEEALLLELLMIEELDTLVRLELIALELAGLDELCEDKAAD
jgi:hypothetical protein